MCFSLRPPGRLLRGGGLKGQTSRLCTKQTLQGFQSGSPVDITNTFFSASWSVWLPGWVAAAWVGAFSPLLAAFLCFLMWCCCLSGNPIDCSFSLRLGGWMAWSLWSACDDSGLQMRSRVCGAQGSTPCVGNGTQRRDCNEIPGESVSCWTHVLGFGVGPLSGMSSLS